MNHLDSLIPNIQLLKHSYQKSDIIMQCLIAKLLERQLVTLIHDIGKAKHSPSTTFLKHFPHSQSTTASSSAPPSSSSLSLTDRIVPETTVEKKNTAAKHSSTRIYYRTAALKIISFNFNEIKNRNFFRLFISFRVRVLSRRRRR